MRDAERDTIDPLMRALLADDLMTRAEAEKLFGKLPDRPGDDPGRPAKPKPKAPRPEPSLVGA